MEGFSFLNDTHIMESCGMYGGSFFNVMEYSQDGAETSLTTTYQSDPYPSEIFLEGNSYLPKKNTIYMLTYM